MCCIETLFTFCFSLFFSESDKLINTRMCLVSDQNQLSETTEEEAALLPHSSKPAEFPVMCVKLRAE